MIKVLTHPVTIFNLILVGSFGFIEMLHIHYHRTQLNCNTSVTEMIEDW